MLVVPHVLVRACVCVCQQVAPEPETAAPLEASPVAAAAPPPVAGVSYSLLLPVPGLFSESPALLLAAMRLLFVTFSYVLFHIHVCVCVCMCAAAVSPIAELASQLHSGTAEAAAFAGFGYVPSTLSWADMADIADGISPPIASAVRKGKNWPVVVCICTVHCMCVRAHACDNECVGLKRCVCKGVFDGDFIVCCAQSPQVSRCLWLPASPTRQPCRSLRMAAATLTTSCSMHATSAAGVCVLASPTFRCCASVCTLLAVHICRVFLWSKSTGFVRVWLSCGWLHAYPVCCDGRVRLYWCRIQGVCPSPPSLPSGLSIPRTDSDASFPADLPALHGLDMGSDASSGLVSPLSTPPRRSLHDVGSHVHCCGCVC